MLVVTLHTVNFHFYNIMLPQYSFRLLGFYLALFLSCSQVVATTQGCEQATDLLFHAYYLYSEGKAVSQQKLLFNKSLQLCSEKPEVHSSLASLLVKQNKDPKAIYHYQEAIRYDKDFFPAWHGLGEIYYQHKRFPLSLEAFSHACQSRKDSKERAINLLKSKRYTFTEPGDMAEQEDLLVLYDTQRRQALNKRLKECGLGEVEVQPIHIFFNLVFDLSRAALPSGTESQLDQIAAVLQQIPSNVKIHGYTDDNPYLYRTTAVSNKLNWELSQQRAETFASALAQRGVSIERMEAIGHGFKEVIVSSKSLSDEAMNRRVELEMEEIKEW